MRLKELQDKLYRILYIINDICQRNCITYWMHGGSAIGAVREHDFIPWDDDMDILIKAEYYPIFLDAMRRELPDNLTIIEPKDFIPYFYDYTIRIADLNCKLRNETKEDIVYNNYQNVACVDVFLLSQCPDAGYKQRLWLLQYDIIYGMAMNYRYRIEYSKYRLVQKVEVAILKILGKIYSRKTSDKIIRLWERFVHAYDQRDTNTRMISNTAVHCYWHPMPDDWFRDTVYVAFRDIHVPVPKEYDKELSYIFGNYMIPIRDTNKYVTHLNEEEFVGF